MNRNIPTNERAFTLIELLMVSLILGLLLLMSSTVFSALRSSANYAVVAQGMGDARKAFVAGLGAHDKIMNALELSQKTAGELKDSTARELLPAFRLSKKVALDLTYDPTCEDLGCEELYIQLRHCQGKEFQRLVRFGNGIEVLQENIQGEGCP
ncbi:MAG: prepilin-type N-terminal cleavage/methylation domain-containing protein [Bdellovibrionota bacterium]|jgi:prepilin-type N-terminal cleavage/methylation domain-containing protein